MRERKKIPAPTANTVGPCPIATVQHSMTFFIISINKTVNLDPIHGCAFVSSSPWRDGGTGKK